jgi:hypothetical protein
MATDSINTLHNSIQLQRYGVESCSTTLRSDRSTVRVSLSCSNPSFRNLFMQMVSRELVVPITSASVSCEIAGNARSGVRS